MKSMFSLLKKAIMKPRKGEQKDQGIQNVEKKKENGPPSIQHVLEAFKDCDDLTHKTYPEQGLDIIFFQHLVDKQEFNRLFLTPVVNKSVSISKTLEAKQYQATEKKNEVLKGIADGHVAIFYQGQCYLVKVYGPESRTIEESNVEGVIVGARDAFVESAITNISLLRRRLKSPCLKAVRFQLGSLSKTDTYVMFVEGIANEEIIGHIQKKLNALQTETILDINILGHHLDEAPNSIFPQLYTTERPDHISDLLSDGKVVIIVDGSPSVMSLPTQFFTFLHSPEDLNQRWILASLTRLIRYLAIFITLFFTPVYVAVTTFHYEMLPQNVLITLAESRDRVPFPPILEALLMELTIELLREAGARLPTKIGQTIGIVGGIVIGQAAVDAGITSNILIISVAISAIASFAIPSYIMSTSIRVIRFALILLAGFWGNYGIMVGVALIVIHVAGLESMGKPYLFPLSPVNVKRLDNELLRTPFKQKSK
jgi:hypothetical protein